MQDFSFYKNQKVEVHDLFDVSRELLSKFKAEVIYGPNPVLAFRGNKKKCTVEIYNRLFTDEDPVLGHDAELFDQDWEVDEGYIGREAKLDEMSGLDRIIFEDCYNGSNAVQRPSQNVPNIGFRRRIDLLAQRLVCTFDQAEDLIDFWQIIDESQKLWPTFELWIKARTIEAGLEYFEALAGQLVDDEIVNEKPFSSFEINPDRELWKEELDVLWEQFVSKEAEPELTVEALDGFVEKNGWFAENGSIQLESPRGTPEEFRYVTINDDRPHPSYIRLPQPHPQPDLFWEILDSIDRSGIEHLNRWLKLFMAKDPRLSFMDVTQRGIFWRRLHNRRVVQGLRRDAYLKHFELTKEEQAILQQYSQPKSQAQLRFFWAQWYSARKGIVSLGRPVFVEFVLKNTLKEAKGRIGENRSPSIPVASDDFEALMNSL